MTLSMAKEVLAFLFANNIRAITIMGGEVCCHPGYKDILSILVPAVSYCRLVTNGDTVLADPAFLRLFPKMKVSISNDQWHTNENVQSAINLCQSFGINYDVADGKETEESIVPVGRGEFSFGAYSMFQTFCSNPDHKYSFLIDEEGGIFKCGFGAWRYTEVGECLAQDSFHGKFKEFNQKFYKAFVPSCKTCSRIWENKKCQSRKEKQD